jgi:hypothetical protein
VEPLLDHLTVVHQPAAVPNDRTQRVDLDLIDPAPTRTLTSQIG